MQLLATIFFWKLILDYRFKTRDQRLARNQAGKERALRMINLIGFTAGRSFKIMFLDN